MPIIPPPPPLPTARPSDDEIAQLRFLFNEWIGARDGGYGPNDDSLPDPAEASRLESLLHSLIKGQFPGVFFNVFDGLLIFVGDATPDGKIETRELVFID